MTWVWFALAAVAVLSLGSIAASLDRVMKDTAAIRVNLESLRALADSADFHLSSISSHAATIQGDIVEASSDMAIRENARETHGALADLKAVQLLGDIAFDAQQVTATLLEIKGDVERMVMSDQFHRAVDEEFPLPHA